MRHGDVILLYTDGMVETPQPRHRPGHRPAGRRRPSATLRGNFVKGADRLVESLGSPNDDRALLLIHRR